jgi:hypothetical protein
LAIFEKASALPEKFALALWIIPRLHGQTGKRAGNAHGAHGRFTPHRAGMHHASNGEKAAD